MSKAILVASFLAVAASRAATPLTLWPSEASKARALPDSKFAVVEGGAIRVETGNQYDWPGVRIGFTNGPKDLSAYDLVRVVLQNVGSHPVRVFLCLKNQRPRDYFLTPGGDAWLKPGERSEIVAGLRLPPWVMDRPLGLVGMRGVPGPLAGGIFDLSQTGELHVTLESPNASAQFEVLGIQTEARETERQSLTAERFFLFVDRFDQFVHAEWPGKVHGDEDLRLDREREAAALGMDAGPADRDRWGGWTRGPKLRATGRFRTEKVSGKWWLVDPDGRLFFSHGVDGVSAANETGVTGRENYFAWLPKEKDPLAAFFVSGGRMPYRVEGVAGAYRAYDFAKANLMRKYGTEWETAFADGAHRRMRAWGLNTLGNWSDARVCRLRCTPYVATVGDAARTIDNHCPDPFAPGFAAEIRRSVQKLKQSGAADDPWCVGVFVDNEIGWGSSGATLAREVLRLPADRPAKQTFAARLQKKYDVPPALNAVWRSAFKTWDDLLKNREVPDGWACNADGAEFLGELAERYFATVHEALRAVAPDLLYLGCRFAWGPTPV